MRYRPTALVVTMAFVIATPAVAAEGMLRFGAGYFRPTGGLEGTTSLGGGSVGAIPILYDDFDTRFALEPEGAVSLFVGYELALSDRFGIQFSIEGFETDLAMEAIHDGRTIETETGDVVSTFRRVTGYSGQIEVYPATISLLYHPVRRPRVDLYLGPLAGWVFSGDAEFDRPERGGYDEGAVKLSDEPVYGAVIGLDLPLDGGVWTFSASARYLRSELSQERVPFVVFDRWGLLNSDRTPRDFDLDSWVVHFGVGRRLGRS